MLRATIFTGFLVKILLGVSVSGTRNFLSWAMIVLFPLSLLATDTGAAVVHSKGGVWVNGTEIVDSTAIFPGDFLQTKPGFAANLDAEGSSVLIKPESVVKFQGNFLILQHGSVAVGTSRSMSVHVNCIHVEPVTSERTQYDVTDTSGAIQVAALKNDVNIKQGGLLKKAAKEGESSQSATVREGEQARRDESAMCGAAPRPGAGGNAMNPLNPKWIEIGGAGAGALVLCLIFCRSSGANSVSPSQP
ncbi:MAG: hypothetical protein WB660_14230 [Candidatus Sulfotelmatobacter sp.]